MQPRCCLHTPAPDGPAAQEKDRPFQSERSLALVTRAGLARACRGHLGSPGMQRACSVLGGPFALQLKWGETTAAGENGSAYVLGQAGCSLGSL